MKWLGNGKLGNMEINPLRLTQVRQMIGSGEARRIRLEAGLSLKELGAGCGSDQSTVSRWESGDRRPRGVPALRYLELLEQISAKLRGETPGGSNQ